jgi:diaminopimelate decarboxylase
VTLADLVPSVGTLGQPPLEEGLWPARTASTTDGDLLFGGMPMTHIAARFGTPCQVLDEAEIRGRALSFLAVLPEAEVVFAGKALPCRAVFRWMHEEGLSLDVCSAGELAVARSVGFPAERILMHGNVKTPEDLKAALAYRAGRIVLDSADEIEQVAGLARSGQAVLLRVTPGVDAHTHHAITTGVDDQKFGFSLASGAAEEGIRSVLAHPGLRLVGLHCHIGSQVRDLNGYEETVRRMVGFIADLRDRHGITISQLDVGGGFAVPYLDGETTFDLPGFAHRLRCTVNCLADQYRIPAPGLIIEPGRSIVATAGVTLYRVITVKPAPSGRTFVAVDGGMSDNPRPTLYGARYTVRLVGRHSRSARRPVTVVGRHCEAGDILAEDVPLPGDVHAGDLLAIPVTGAYHYSLASNYNLVCRPPVIGVRDGIARPLVRRETEEDLLRRDLG